MFTARALLFLVILPLQALSQDQQAVPESKWLRIRPGFTYNSLQMEGYQPLQTQSQIFYRFGLEFEYAFLPKSQNWTFAVEPTYQYYEAHAPYIQTYNSFSYQSVDLGLSFRRYFPISNGYRLFINAGSDISMPLQSELVYTYGPNGSQSEIVTRLAWRSGLIVGGGYSHRRFTLEFRYSYRSGESVLSNGNRYGGVSAILAYTLNKPKSNTTGNTTTRERQKEHVRLRAGATYKSVHMPDANITSYGPDPGFRFGVEYEHQFPFSSASWCILIEPVYQFSSSTSPVPFTPANATAEYKAIDFGLGLRYYFPSSSPNRFFVNAGTAFTQPISSRVYYSDALGSYGSYDLPWKLPIIAGLGWSGNKITTEVRYTYRTALAYVGADYSTSYSGFEFILGWTVL